MAAIAHQGDIEASNEASIARDIKKQELLQNVVFKVTICIVTVTSGVILQNSPMGQLRRATTAQRVLLIVYVVAMFLSFSLGLAVLLFTIPCQNMNAIVVLTSASVVRKVMWVSIGFVYAAVAIGTVLALVEV